MAIRDLVPWRRQESMAPAIYNEREHSPFAQLRREMDRLFDDFFHAPMSGEGRAGGAGTGWPSLEVKESEEQVTILPSFRA